RTMSANRKGGFCSFNSKAIRDFDLRPGNRVIIAKDTDSKNDWYIAFVEPENEAGTKLRIGLGHKTSKIYSMRTQNRAASGAILDSVKATYSATFIIAATPTQMPDGTIWYRVLTANPIRTK
ncbi:MAG: hypothetical protein NC548_62745, partial [Lachnospiraceae bacterium]|nr:hypothetical protein [Lachnospiraceae bacterium]